MTVIRLSPSGPDILNDDGGPFDPGDGAMLRLAEITTAGSQALTDTPVEINATNLRVGVAGVNDDLRYRFECDVPLRNNGSTDTEATLDLQVSYDGGTGWTTLKSGTYTIQANSQISARVINPNTRANLLPSYPATTPASLFTRVLGSIANAAATVSTNTGLTNNQYIALSEHF